jgi:hypothetical protein
MDESFVKGIMMTLTSNDVQVKVISDRKSRYVSWASTLFHKLVGRGAIYFPDLTACSLYTHFTIYT